MSRIEQLIEAMAHQQTVQQQQQQHFLQEQAQMQQDRAAAVQSNVLRRISAMHPPTYEGQMDPKILENWIRDMDKLLDATNCPQEQRVAIAVYYLREAADHWWSSSKVTLLAQAGFGWERLKEKLRSQFYPYSVQKGKYNEFLHLRQREMTPLEYARF